ncbi:helix-turn-helix domain-containing protein [Thermomonas haemolytica]|uniref:Helix-turn-helix protein n=1 Tax=Thermomonas haemolytica TaxID=141949 RepID=A0A4R3NCD9_9GAMM|nr:helix-turn-helix protein [Thermomonas haemolytica]TNY28624.1 hypothetical protein BV505_09415 [Thermomonas haemolytica]
MARTYTHLSAEERGLIMAETLRGSAGVAIARMLGRSPSTVARELRRNAHGERYDATLAGSAYRERRKACGRACKLVDAIVSATKVKLNPE